MGKRSWRWWLFDLVSGLVCWAARKLLPEDGTTLLLMDAYHRLYHEEDVDNIRRIYGESLIKEIEGRRKTESY